VLDSDDRPRPGTRDVAPGLVIVTVYHLVAAAAAGFPRFFDRELEPVLRAAAAAVVGCYCTEHNPNNFPALPVRTGEEAFVWLSLFADEASHGRHVADLESSRAWQDWAAPALDERLDRKPLVLRLTPTARSLLRP
jgi:hypothetical protein